MSNPCKDFDLDDPKLPEAIKAGALTSDGYPYAEKLEKALYEAELFELQKQLVALQSHMLATGGRMMILFEGRDAAGKSGVIDVYRANLNPRNTITVALPKPDERERTQWYFQRYVTYLPAAGETMLFDRSWYNRSIVERVMGYATSNEAEAFLAEAPPFERLLVNDGIHLFKFWLSIGREMQFKRFHDRRHDPLRNWKLSPIDVKALGRWDDYTAAGDRTLATTDTAEAPWTVVLANDKRRARLNVIRAVLDRLDYNGKDEAAIGPIDRKIVLPAAAFLNRRG